MICTVDVDIQSSNPDFPLKEWKAFKGSPTSIRIRNVPRKVGAWDITEVNVKCVYPDNTAHVVAAVLTGCVWVATIPASDAVGFVDGGYSIEADGTDERGNAVTGYRLGEGKVTIIGASVSAHSVPGIEFARVFDTKPKNPTKGDFALGSLEIFDGETWRAIGPSPEIGTTERIEPYLYEVNGAAIDESFGEAYFRELFGDGAASSVSKFGACSCLRVGNEFARAYDWKYDESVSFLVRTKSSGTRFASVAVCASPDGLTRQTVESKTAATNLFSAVPFYALDGINENGVACCVNVVPANADGTSAWSGRDFCAVGAVRHVLDHARTAEEGATLVANGAWMPSPESLGGYSLHFMVADGSKTYVVEDGQIFDISSAAVKAMTNFRVGGRDFLDANGYADVDKIAEYDPYGTGAERYDAIVYRTLHPFAESLREWLTAFKHSDAYAFADTPRPSDFAGVEIEPGVRAKINDTLDIEEWFVENDIHGKWLDRTRDGTFWQTVHSSVYDIAARSLQLVAQEGDTVHTFPIVKSDSEPADYSTVRTNAAAGAAHAQISDGSNPHKTLTPKVLTVDGQKVFDGANEITAFCDLLEVVRKGGVSLLDTVAGTIAKEAVFHPHMADETAIRFDATGTLGDKVYTCSFAFTPKSGGGIVVSRGDLTEVVKSSELAPFAKTAEVVAALAKKRDKSDMFTEWEFDGHEPYCPNPSIKLEGAGIIKYVLYSGSKVWGETYDAPGVLSLEFTSEDYLGTVVTATRQRILTTDDVTTDLVNPTEGKAAEAAAVKTALEKRLDKTEGVLEAGSFGLSNGSGVEGFFIRKNSGIYIGTPTGIIEIPEGTMGDTMAVISDIADATKLTPVFGEWVCPGAPEGFEIVYSEGKWHLITPEGDDHEATNAVPDATKIKGFEGLEKLIATRSIVGYNTAKGEYVSAQTSDDITTLAEAACADNPSASVASLEGRVVPCVSGASGTVDVSFSARKEGDTTLRFFDILIKDVPSGGCQINLPPTESFIYGNALKAEEGWNHYSFAEFKDGDTYKWAVNRVKMSTSQS